MELTIRLRETMSATHASIESLPLSKALAGGTVARDDYRRLLCQLLLLHEALEDELVAHDETRDFFTPDMARADALRGDLVALGADEVDVPLGETLHLAEWIHAWGAEEPWRLFGALYVFEGSRMGSMFLVRPVARALGVPVEPGRGVDYHLDGIARRPQTWAAFKVRLNQLPLSDQQWDDVVAAASQTMDGLHELYSALSGQFTCVVNS